MIVRYKVRRSSDGKYATGSNPFRRIAWGKGFEYLKLEDAKRCEWVVKVRNDLYNDGAWGKIELVKVTYDVISEEVVNE